MGLEFCFCNHNKKFSSYKDATIIFLEGDYYIDEYGITTTKLSSSMYFRFY